MKVPIKEVIKIKGGDSKYWWEGAPEAQEAYSRVCRRGWEKTREIKLDPDFMGGPVYNCFLLYYTALSIVERHIASHPFLWESPDNEEATQPKKGGPQ